MHGFDGDAPSKPFGNETEFGFSPDGKEVVFSARLAGKTEPWSTNFDIYGVPADGSGQLTNYTEANKAWDTGVVFSPDGKFAAARIMKRPGFEADRWQIVIHDETTGKDRELAPDWDRSAQTLAWSPDWPGRRTARRSTRSPRTSARPGCSRSTSSPERSRP